jgi:U3 small nucleolar RNA-associated protein 14
VPSDEGDDMDEDDDEDGDDDEKQIRILQETTGMPREAFDGKFRICALDMNILRGIAYRV